MTLFPKKYTTKDLQRLQTQYQLAHPTSSSAFSLFSLPANQNFHLGHLYGIYLQDFINQSATTPNLLPHKGVIFEPKGMLSIYQAQQFFAKKRQTLSQIGTTKLLTYLKAQQEKKTKANQKMLKAYAGIPAETFTYTTEFSQFILENFAKLRESGKITSRKNIGYRSIDLQSTLADQDIIRKKEQGKNYTIKYFIETKSDILPVCSEVPDTIFGDVALLVHPQDKRYKKLVGKNAIIPIVNRMIPILTDESVDFSKGNGVKRVNPCADFASIALAEKYKLPLDHYIFDKEGKYTEYAGSEYQGKSRKDFYDNIVQYLEDISNLGQIYNQEILAPYYRHSQERLYPFLVEEVVTNLKTDKETLLTTIEGKKLFPETQEGILSAIRNVSGVINRQIPRGIPVPLVKDTKGYKHFNPTLLENGAYTEEIQRYFDFSLLWLSLHHYLKPSFDFTQLLRALTQQKGHLANTLNLLRKSDKKADKPIQKLLTLLERLTEEEKPLNDFEKLIQDSQVLRPQEEEFFLALPQKKEAIVFLGATFDTDFLASLYPIFLAEQKKTIAPAIPLEEGRERRLASELVRQQALLGKPLFTEATLFPGYIDPKKQERFSYETLQTNQIFTLLDEYGVAPLRISLLVQNGFSLESI
ncbi:MAG: class I tRNA ligase family protein [Candidatus Peribacteria bacterium]|jgi:isoleucyl-tRNA synthetase|nr:class I tRNA ligase family protein [Candidatus Peribacteria bacterium]